jgi:hypothetical protein
MNIDPLRHALSDPKRTISSESTCKAAAAELETAARYIAHNLDQRQVLFSMAAQTQ